MVLQWAQAPWLGRDALLDQLAVDLWGFRPDRPRLDVGLVPEDPYLWAITGGFGAARTASDVPGGILACSRYGTATRDILTASSLTDPVAFQLMGATMAAFDDASAWPEGAVARMFCMLTWDDETRVAILDEQQVLPLLQVQFADVTRTGDAEHYGANWQDYAPIYGARGYLLEARAGPRTAAVQVDRMRVELRVTHQRITFRAFLMGGGV